MKATLTALAMLASLTAGAAVAQVVVSSKIDTEGALIGSLIAQTLEGAGVPVTERLQLGGTPVMREAIVAGQIDIYPEYTSNAGYFFNEPDSPAWRDATTAYARAAELDLAANRIVWLAPAPANNTWAIALRSDLAGPNGLATMSQMGEWIAKGGDYKLAASAEFVSSPAALPAFQQTYGFTLTPPQLVTLAGGDTAATIAAAGRGTSGVNAAMVYGTDGGISAVGLVVMEDDKGVQPVYQPAAIIREPVLAQYPQIRDILAPVFASLTLPVLQDLNGRIQVGGEPAEEVARAHLAAIGLTR